MKSREGVAETSRVVIELFDGDDPVRNSELRVFLEREAALFHTTIDNGELITAVRKHQIQVLFLAIGGEIVGCATQFPTAIPQWDTNAGTFYFIPAVHSEDMCVDRTGMGTSFMQQRVLIAASEGKNCGFDLRGKVRAGAVVGEQRWHGAEHGEGTAIGGLLSKFSTEMAKDRSDTVLRLNASTFPMTTAIRDIETLSLGNPRTGNASCSLVRPEVFAVIWKPEGTEKIAATFTLGTSTYTGHSVVRVHIKSDGNLATYPALKFAIANLLAEGRAEIVDRGWIEKTVDPLNRMYIHALGEKELRAPLKEAGAEDRLVGDCLMYPLVMTFANIPLTMVQHLQSPAPLVTIGSRSSAMRLIT